MRYYIISGEASGDLHGSNLIKEISKRDGNAEFRAWGGDLMQKEGAEIVKHYRDLAFMGFTEVLLNIRIIMNNLKLCKNDLLEYKPDALILIDYPGFNLRIAEFASKNNLKVFYYISPQIWAWKKSRVYKIKKFVDRMFVILPYEKDFYARFGYEVDFVGHPLLDVVNGFPKQTETEFRNSYHLGNIPVIALLPGSRKQEISKMLPVMLSVINKFGDFQFVVAGAPSIEKSLYNGLIGNKKVPVVYGNTYELLSHSQAALVTSGTATLETALFGVPEVVCYKGGYISYQIARRVVDRSIIKFISLVNLIMDREVVKELIQKDLTATNLERELQVIAVDSDNVERIKKDYKQLREKLGGSGASGKAAQLIVDSPEK
ncbi:MAG: lipid-A-disaccharide synthase [Bacteroidales bacterium]|nr:lipid-A-disaccharide synthase [Bacteroidales bacterium]